MKGRARRGACLAALALALLATSAAGREKGCELALVLALDVSGSVDPGEWRLQADGLAAAFRAPELRTAALDLQGVVHVAVTQWTGAGRQMPALDWLALRSEADLDRLAAAIETMPRAWRHFSTAIGEAIRHAVLVGRGAPADCRRRVIDVSGDGVSNEGLSPDTARRAAHA